MKEDKIHDPVWMAQWEFLFEGLLHSQLVMIQRIRPQHGVILLAKG
jgi:hypothetical protein